MRIRDWSSDVCSSDLKWRRESLSKQVQAMLAGFGVNAMLRYGRFGVEFVRKQPSGECFTEYCRSIDIGAAKKEHAQRLRRSIHLCAFILVHNDLLGLANGF